MSDLRKISLQKLTKGGKRLGVVLITLILMIAAHACDDADDKQTSTCEGILCTEEFRSLYITVVDENSDPVALDAFEIFSVSSDEDITPAYSAEDLEGFQMAGTYPLINDAYLEQYKNRLIDLRFSGFIGNELVAERIITTGFDCCHVYLEDGDLTITLAQQ